MERNSLISERYLLRGAPNARDLGGLPTVDGRKVRTGAAAAQRRACGHYGRRCAHAQPIPAAYGHRLSHRSGAGAEAGPCPCGRALYPLPDRAADGDRTDARGARRPLRRRCHARKNDGGQGAGVYVRDVPEPCHARLLDRALPAVFLPICSHRRTGRCSTTAPRARTASASARCCC